MPQLTDTNPAGHSRTALLRVNLLILVLGVIVGVLASVPLTWFGKLISGMSGPITWANYLWNMRVFGLMGGIIAPVVAWSALRRVPLWRAALEPAAGGLIGAMLAMVLGIENLFIFLTGSGVILSSWRLNHIYRENPRLTSGDDQTKKLPA